MRSLILKDPGCEFPPGIDALGQPERIVARGEVWVETPSALRNERCKKSHANRASRTDRGYAD
jgi:hypothetical protein